MMSPPPDPVGPLDSEGPVDPAGLSDHAHLNREYEIEDLLELRPPADVVSSYRDATDREWSRRWPAEQIWRVRRR